MNLILDIAWTHVRARVRQTGIAVAGVATGVGFSIMMASLMQGSQDDFTARLVNTCRTSRCPIERRAAPQQPAETLYDSAEIRGLTPEARRRGIKNPLATMAVLEAWLPGGVAPSVQGAGASSAMPTTTSASASPASTRAARGWCPTCRSRCAARR